MMRESISLSLPKLRSSSKHLNYQYSSSFQTIFDSAMNSIKKKQLRQTQHKQKSIKKVKMTERLTLNVPESLSKTITNRSNIPPMPLLSKILQKSRQLNQIPVCKVTLKSIIHHKNYSTERQINKENNRTTRLKIKRKDKNKLKKIFDENCEFDIEPWINDQITDNFIR